jgi:hypothetical protein
MSSRHRLRNTSRYPIMRVGKILICMATHGWLCLLAGASTVRAENSVTINDFVEQPPGATIEVPVLISNDVELRQLIIPLVFRQLNDDQAFFTDAKASYRDRLPPSGPDAPLTAIQFTNRYDNEDGTCKEGKTGGFYTITYLNDTTSHPVGGAPLAFMFVRIRVSEPNLAPGNDETGSMVFTLALNDQSGCFYIDTTCTNPINHLDFQSGDNAHIVPTFRSGQVCIDASCHCPYQCDFDQDGYRTAVDLSVLIDILFAGHPDVQDQACTSARADLDCDGFATAFDLTGLIDYLFASGPGPCDPCNP